MAKLIHHFLENSADAHPEFEAVVHGNKRVTYRDIEAMSNRIAAYLLDVGIQKGDRVAILLRNSVAYIVVYYGILKTGAVAVPLNTGVAVPEIIEIIRDCTPGIMFYESAFYGHLEKMLQHHEAFFDQLIMVENADRKNEFQYTNYETVLEKYPDARPSVNVEDTDLSSIIYTSGSTGKAKGVMLTHASIVANTTSIVSYLKLCSSDRCMVILPFYYVYGKSLLNTHFAVSGSVIIDNRFTFPNVILRTMQKEQATGFSGVPSTYSILLNKSAIAKMQFPHLRYFTQAGGHMAAAVKEKLLALFPDKRIFIMYGATEASARLSYLQPECLTKKINSIGKAIPGVELKVVTDDGREANAYEEGEIVATGQNIMLGYWHKKKETQKVLQDGWYYTGDIGYKDEEGYFFVTGRKKDMIKVGTRKVSAVEVEEVLYQYDGVQEAAVVGIEDELRGESIKAFIVLSAKAAEHSADALISFCAERLPFYKIPKEVIFCKSLPKNESGKILKCKLLEMQSVAVC